MDVINDINITKVIEMIKVTGDYNMKKSFILEQCRRIEVIHSEESEEAKANNEKWLIVYNEGYKEVINDFKSLLKSTGSNMGIGKNEKQVLKKWLKKVIKQSHSNITELDKKYNYVNNIEEISEEDKINYNFNFGMDCMAYTLIDILDRKLYVNKLK